MIVAPVPISTQAIYAEVNEVRVEYRLPQLVESPVLTKAAEAKAADMVKKGYFAHRGPGGYSLWLFIPWATRYTEVGENLAKGFKTSEGVRNGWLNSPKHKELMLEDDFKETGVAVTKNAAGETIVVQLFAR